MSAAAVRALRETEVCKARGAYSQAIKQTKNPQLGVWLWVPLHAQHRQIKRNLATTAIIFAMRVMQMTQ